jgi:hypothetical protein
MAETRDGSLDPSVLRQAPRPAAIAISLILLFAGSVAAQPPQPLYVPPPAGNEFFSRYDFHMSIESLSPPKDTPEQQADERFSWDTHFGGSFDLVDLVVLRGGVMVDYEAVEGSEYRPFDPNQGNYALEAFVSGRVRGSEIGAILHHVSRHLGDRPKRESIAWNELGARVLHRFETAAATVDLDVEGGRIMQHSFVDYTWLGEVDALVRHPISPRIGLFGMARLQLFGVDEVVAGRGTQTGAVIEGGVRLGGRGGIMELYLGYENRVDAYPLDRIPQHWGLAGLRLVSR